MQEAARTNEEAQVVIEQLRADLLQLEYRCRQVRDKQWPISEVPRAVNPQHCLRSVDVLAVLSPPLLLDAQGLRWLCKTFEHGYRVWSRRR